MNDSPQGQVTRSAAEIYEEFFVPALFEEWPPRVLDAARTRPGQRVLDVACGTGVLAREAARRVGHDGSVTGIDRNEGMLAVARRQTPAIQWQNGVAEALPAASEAFDTVVCQFGLMFFDDRAAALKEMWRVLRPGGGLAVAVWDDLEHSPGYAAMVVLLDRLFGKRIADELRAPFALGDANALASLLEGSGIPGVEIATYAGIARFPSLGDWVRTDIKGWTLADLIDDAQYELLLAESRQALAALVGHDGTVAFASPAHIASAVKR
jgi:SAM-dependent methyltransferase